MAYVIECTVSGGVTGRRASTLKSNGEVKFFESFDEANTEAVRLTEARNNSNSVAFFSYRATEWMNDPWQ